MTAENRGPVYPDLAGGLAVVCGHRRVKGHRRSLACCRLLAANGVAIVVKAGAPGAIQAIVGDVVDAGGQAIGLAGDCIDPDDIWALRKAAESAFGAVDVLMAYAGAFDWFTPVTSIMLQARASVIELNLI